MGDITTIGWTDKTHNEWIGCQKVTEEECGDCYAWRWAVRHKMEVWGSLSGSDRHHTKTHDNPRCWNREAQALGRRYKEFCASLSDVFEPHPQVQAARIGLWQLIEETPLLDWQILTKRPKFRGYSGTQNRPMQLSWARKLLAECRAYKVAFFMKQLGSVYAREHGLLQHPKGEDITEFPDDLQVQEFPHITPRYQKTQT